MKIVVENTQDAKACATALAEYIERTLKASGYLHQQPLEDKSYYPAQRELLHNLLSWTRRD